MLRLRDVRDALDVVSDEVQVALERDTGRIVEIFDSFVVGEDVDGDVTLDDVEEGDAWVLLPDRFEIHEWSILRSFCDQVADDAVRDRLLRAVHGRGAFRYFRDEVYAAGLQDDWYAYRDARMTDLARDWLEREGIAYTEEG